MIKFVNNASLGGVAGWGLTNKTGKLLPSAILQKACIRPITQKQCDDVAYQKITSSMMCTRTDVADADKGDSGGGLIFLDIVSRKWILGGVVSGELEVCISCPKTALYMRITRSVVQWINETTQLEV